MSRFNGLRFTSDNQFAIAFDWTGNINVGLAHNLTRLRLNNIQPSAPVALMAFAGNVDAAGWGWRLTALDSQNNFIESVSMTWRFPSGRSATNNWLNIPIPDSVMPGGLTDIAGANAFRARNWALQWQDGAVPGFVVVNQGAVTVENAAPTAVVTGNAFQPVINQGALTVENTLPEFAAAGAGIDIVVQRGTVTAENAPPEFLYLAPARGRVTTENPRAQSRVQGEATVVRNRGAITVENPLPTASVVGSTRAVPMPAGIMDAFIVEANNTVVPVTSVEVSGQSIEISLDSPVRFGQEVRVEYTDPASASLRDRGGNSLMSFPERVVENEVLNPVDTSPPRVESAETTEDGQMIILRLNEPVEVTDN